MKKPSIIILILILITSVYIMCNNKQWKNGKVIVWDIVNYYEYLPATFIYHDLHFDYTRGKSFPNAIYWLTETEDGKFYNKMTMGMAICYAPFFLMALGIDALTTTTVVSGFGEVYNLFLVLSDIFYTGLGLFFLRKILLREKFSENIIAVTLAGIYAGTNLMFYSVYDVMPHNYLFALITIYLWQVIKWLENPVSIRSLKLGLVAGLIILIRPVHALTVVLIFMLYGVKGISDLKERLRSIWDQKLSIALIKLSAFSVLFLQMMYWKSSTGHWIYWSYGDESFFFKNPHMINGLFGFRKGWIMYSPLMLPVFIHLFFLRKRLPDYSILTPVLFLIYSYIIFSWWCWWYGGSFGSRPMIDLYGLMGIVLASFFAFVSEIRVRAIRIASSVFIFLTIAFSCLRTYQFHVNIIHFDSMTAFTWKYTLLHPLKVDHAVYDPELIAPDYEKAKKYGSED